MKSLTRKLADGTTIRASLSSKGEGDFTVWRAEGIEAKLITESEAVEALNMIKEMKQGE